MIEMDFIYQMICVLEVIVVNMYLFGNNVKRRYSMKIILPTLVLYTLILIPFGVVIIKGLGIYGDGNALFTLFGFFYLLPVHFLFEGKLSRHFYSICFCWIYTLLISSLAIQFGFILERYGRFLMTMIASTSLYLLSFYFVMKFVKNYYMPLLKCQEETVQGYLNRSCLVWFLTILVLNLHFIYDNSYLKIVTMIIIGMNVLLNYQLMFEVLQRGSRIGSLSTQVVRDTLTSIGNRLAFNWVYSRKTKDESSFTLVYMDLDNFKDVNDTYGHSTGDEYLKEFAMQISEIAGEENVFRISGDEFALFVNNENLDTVLVQIQHIRFMLEPKKVTFYGVSYGYATYPSDGLSIRSLFDAADKHMYTMKQFNKKDR